MIVQKSDVLAHAGIALANLDRQRTLPCRRTHQLSGSTCFMVSRLPSRFSPAAARMTASYSPASSLRRRVSTLPRKG